LFQSSLPFYLLDFPVFPPTLCQARAASKDSRLRSLLSDSVQAVRYLYPSYGSAELVELPFRNPYASEHCFTVAWEDAMCQLTIVTDLGEWRALKVIRLIRSST
jgi:hypothetical protein